jgi:hypothetical protein
MGNFHCNYDHSPHLLAAICADRVARAGESVPVGRMGEDYTLLDSVWHRVRGCRQILASNVDGGVLRTDSSDLAGVCDLRGLDIQR